MYIEFRGVGSKKKKGGLDLSKNLAKQKNKGFGYGYA